MSALKLVLAMPLELDCQALSGLVRQKQKCNLIAETDLNRATSACYDLRPDFFLLGFGFDRELSLRAAGDLIHVDAVGAVGFIDQTLAVYRAAELMKLPRTCYFTRRQTIEEIFDQLHNELNVWRSGTQGQKDDFRENLRSTVRVNDEHNVLGLTAREQTVLRELAVGKSVGEIASKLQIARSTVDNHKTRLMKKLAVHRTSALLQIALRSGVLWTRLDTAHQSSNCPTKPHMR